MKFSLEKVAALCHELNRVYCTSIGDFSQPEWLDAPEWQRASAIEGVRFRLRHTREEPAEPSASHNSWLDHKIEQGWSYGPVKDALAKTHPCMVPFDQLPPEQKMKDYLFACAVESLRECELIEGAT